MLFRGSRTAMYLRPGRLLPPCSWLTVGGPISQIKHTRAAIAGAGPLWPARVRMVLRHLMSVGTAYGALQRHRPANASKKNDIGGDSVGDPRSCCGSERTIVCDRKTVDEAAHPGPPAAQPAERRSGDEIGPPTAENTRALGAGGRQSAVYTLFPGCQFLTPPAFSSRCQLWADRGSRLTLKHMCGRGNITITSTLQVAYVRP